jgi:hypothetical protein
MPTDHVTFTPNVVVGLGLAAVGVVLLLDRMGIIEARELAGYWPVLLILFGGSVSWQALRGEVNGKRPRPIIGPGLVLIIAVFSILGSQAWERRDRFEKSGTSQDAPSLFALMGQARSTSYSTNLQSAEMTSVMGSSRLDLREAKIAPGQEATVDVFGLMGEVELIVPEGWVIDVRAVPVMGGVRDSRPFGSRERRIAEDDDRGAERDGDAPAATPVPPAASPKTAETPVEAPPDAAGPAPRLVVRGFIMMGALKIRS